MLAIDLGMNMLYLFATVVLAPRKSNECLDLWHLSWHYEEAQDYPMMAEWEGETMGP